MRGWVGRKETTLRSMTEIQPADVLNGMATMTTQ